MWLTHFRQDVICGSFEKADVNHHSSVNLRAIQLHSEHHWNFHHWQNKDTISHIYQSYTTSWHCDSSRQCSPGLTSTNCASESGSGGLTCSLACRHCCSTARATGSFSFSDMTARLWVGSQNYFLQGYKKMQHNMSQSGSTNVHPWKRWGM